MALGDAFKNTMQSAGNVRNNLFSKLFKPRSAPATPSGTISNPLAKAQQLPGTPKMTPIAGKPIQAAPAPAPIGMSAPMAAGTPTTMYGQKVMATPQKVTGFNWGALNQQAKAPAETLQPKVGPVPAVPPAAGTVGEPLKPTMQPGSPEWNKQFDVQRQNQAILSQVGPQIFGTTQLNIAQQNAIKNGLMQGMITIRPDGSYMVNQNFIPALQKMSTQITAAA